MTLYSKLVLLYSPSDGTCGKLITTRLEHKQPLTNSQLGMLCPRRCSNTFLRMLQVPVPRFLDYQSEQTDKADKADISVRLIQKVDTEKV